MTMGVECYLFHLLCVNNQLFQLYYLFSSKNFTSGRRPTYVRILVFASRFLVNLKKQIVLTRLLR